MTSFGSEDLKRVRMGEAIKACVLAEGGWMDWAADGSVRFLRRGAGGRVGTDFSATLMKYMREHRDDVKVYIEFERDRRRKAEEFRMTDVKRRRKV